MKLALANEPGLNHEAFRLVLDTIRDGVYVVDRDRRIVYWNKGAEQLSGYPAEEVVGRWCYEGMLAHVDQCGKCLCHAGCPLAATIDDRQPRRADVFMHHRDGHRVPVNVEAAALLDETGEAWGAVEVFYDNSADQTTQRTLRMFQRMAMLDSLTGLPNRRFLDQHLARVGQQVKDGVPCGLMLIDIDHFKQVNDRHGHEVGDRVLKAVGATLNGVITAPHVAGRWGGEEVLAVLSGGDREEWTAIAQRARALIGACFIQTHSGPLRITASAGISQFIPNESVDGCMDRTDRALYRSKAEGRNRLTWADEATSCSRG